MAPCRFYWISLYIYWVSGILIDSWPFNLFKRFNFRSEKFLSGTENGLFSASLNF